MRGRNYGCVSWVAVLFCLCICFCNCEEEESRRQTYVIRYKDGDQTIPVTVVLDYKKQTEYVINMNPRTPAKSVTLYDFKQRTIAYKDLTNRECFLGRLTYETMSEESNALQDVKSPVEVRPKVRSLDPRAPALTPTEIRNIAGQKTAVFCRKMNTWLLMPEKAHSIRKREADDYEERTYQYQGHRSSQYSHFERETKRRFRNRHHNSRRRSHRKESEAENEYGGLGLPESSTLLPHLNIQSSNGVRINPGFPDSNYDAPIQNRSSGYRVPKSSYLAQTNVFNEKENSRASSADRLFSISSNIDPNFRTPNEATKEFSPNVVPIPSGHIFNRSHDFSRNATDKVLGLVHELIPNSSKNASKHSKESTFLAKFSKDSFSEEDKPTTTIPPYVPFGQGHPNVQVHSSLVYLLPLYKPLSQEFDFNQETGTEKNDFTSLSEKQRDIEREGHPLPTLEPLPKNSFTHYEDLHNSSYNPDVSLDVLEIPRISKEFENIKTNKSHQPSSQSVKANQLQGSVETNFNSSRNNSHSSTHLQKNNTETRRRIYTDRVPLSSKSNIGNTAKDTDFRENASSEVSISTELPVITAESFTHERTTPDPLYNPSVHTAFQNSEDFNSFQIFPNYIENSRASTERNLSSLLSPVDRADENSKIPHHLVLTTEYTPTIEKYRVDIPNEDQSPPFNHAVLNFRKTPYIPTPNNTIDLNVPPYKIRYQSALLNFKPDEIVIDIGNIPTHTPPPVTSGLHLRLPTTFQPTSKSVSSNEVRNDINQRSEQVLGTTWRSSHPTTRYPRRRISDKSRRPVQNSSTSFAQRGSLNHNRYQSLKPPTHINQLVGVNHFNSRYTPRHHFHRPNRPIAPARVIVPSETNHLHHISHLNNLPPGVSVHPRHPQAPFADMIHSNRPPTIPFSDDNQAILKPHRQRHHRKKERHPNSCCRLRGQSGAFQSCCQNGGPCCSRSGRRMQPAGAQCCSSSNTIEQIIPSKEVQPPVRITNQTLSLIRTENTHRSELNNKDRCQKEKMCRTLYESTQQVMVCRNAHIEGC